MGKRIQQYPICFAPEQMAMIRQIAGELKVNMSDIIRWAVADYADNLGYDFPRVEIKRGTPKKNPASNGGQKETN